MSHSSKLFTGGIALLLISASGCAGQGLKSMFARNETDGYKTLEELEAEEAKVAEGKSAIADADSEGPRFAPWLPFGKKSSEETDVNASDAIASNSAVVPDSTDTEAPVAWWKNPFRRREPVELDPFLTQEELPSTTVAQNKNDAAVPSKSVDAADKDSEPATLAQFEGSEKAVSHKTESNAVPSEDELLAEKFEKHFQKNTIETADASDQAKPLIIAGESTRTVRAKSESSATDKLAELERLLEEKRSSATVRRTNAASFADESVAHAEDSGDFTEASHELKSIAKSQPSPNNTRADQAIDSFDSLLAMHSSDDSPPTRRASANQGSDSPRGNSAPPSNQVEVAKADWLFGAAAAASVAKETRESLTKTASSGWSDTASDTGFQWIQAARRAGAHNQRAQQTGGEQSQSEQTEIQVAESPATRTIPAASLPDTPDRHSPNSTGSLGTDSRRRTDSESGMMRTVSASREVSSPATPEGLADDSFFTQTTSTTDPQDLNDAKSKSADSVPTGVFPADRGSRRLLNGRHWLLLLGGIIVVALLFAPARKKPIQAHHAPMGG